jgi:3-phosphoshikimate 1-carboxyvinyltransferase
MALPDLIEIEPIAGPLHAAVTVPGSKSITNRALILAALAQGETVLRGALWSEDTQIMVECLQQLGFTVRVELDPAESGNRTITVQGAGGTIPNGGTREHPVELFVGNAGTAARFLSPLVCLGRGFYRLSGIPRMHERPQGALLEALQQLGYAVEPAPGGKLPALIEGRGPVSGRCKVSIRESSQFASGLLLCAEPGGWQVEVADENAEESSYVEMTRQLVKVFPSRGGVFQIEPDASGGSYFWAAAQLVNGHSLETVVNAWPESGWQIDARFPEFLRLWPKEISRTRDLGDSIMTAIVMAPFQQRTTVFSDLGRLRAQECERVAALRTELTRCGAKVTEQGDSLWIKPSPLHGAEIDTYNDHRMAMCFAVIGLKVPGIRLRQPNCVKKTFPTFFQKLVAPPPAGLGTRILDASGRALESKDLLAE